MVTSDQVRSSKAIQRQTGRTFHVATRVLPERVRYPTYVLYAFFRKADEVVDDPDPPSPGEQRAELERMREAALGERDADDPVLDAVADLVERHGIPDREIDAFVDAMAMDVDRGRYESHEALSTYLRGSAVAVGYMMLEVMDPPAKERARPHAKALGEAFQLTNFLRDVREDVLDYDRIYLPEKRLREHGLDHSAVEALEYSPAFADAMEAELRRTERLYHEGVAGIQYLPEDCRLAVLAAAVLYADHHRLIRDRDGDTLSATPDLTLRRRVELLARTWWAWRRTDDPLTAFYRVSTVEPPADWEPAGTGDRSHSLAGPRRYLPSLGVASALRRVTSTVRSALPGIGRLGR